MKTRTLRRIVSLALFVSGVSTFSAALPGGDTPPRDGPNVRARRVNMWGMNRAYLGIELLDLTPELRQHYGVPKDQGVLVSRVTPDSPAAKAGIVVGDVVTAIDGQAVASFWDVSGAMADRRKGDKVEVELMRDRTSKKIGVTVDEKAEDSLLGPKLEKKIVLSGDGGPARTIVIGDEPVLAGEPMERMDTFFRSPEWKAKLDDMSECDRVRKRLEAVEERLRALEKKMPSK